MKKKDLRRMAEAAYYRADLCDAAIERLPDGDEVRIAYLQKCYWRYTKVASRAVERLIKETNWMDRD